MLIELMTMAVIFGGGIAAMLAVKRKYHAQIEQSIDEIERRDSQQQQIEQEKYYLR